MKFQMAIPVTLRQLDGRCPPINRRLVGSSPNYDSQKSLITVAPKNHRNFRKKKKDTKAVGNSLKGFRNDGKVVNLLERFQNYGKGFTSEIKDAKILEYQERFKISISKQWNNLKGNLSHTAGLDTIFVQIYMDTLPGVPGVSKNQISFFTNKTVEFLR
jgi:hypothetical protein